MKKAKTKDTHKRIILASTSPRRIELLKQVGLRCEVVAPTADETARRNERPSSLVARLALEKAQSAANSLKRGQTPVIIIAADTIVVTLSDKARRGSSDAKILGKPRTVAEAGSMLRKLQGSTHTVLTGYCILEVDSDEAKGFAHSHVRVVRSRVTMRPLSVRQIQAYIATGEPMDKAGSYAAQGIGMSLIEKIDGSYTNVVGLPISQVVQDLEEHFEVRVLG